MESIPVVNWGEFADGAGWKHLSGTSEANIQIRVSDRRKHQS